MSLTSKLFVIVPWFLLSAAGLAQTPIQFGDRDADQINSPGQTRTYFFQANGGDTLRVNFWSEYAGYPVSQHKHVLEVRQGATTIGSVIVGRGTLTAALPTTGYYTLHVRARNNQYTGAYALRINRLNDPVGADRQPFDWTIEGQISGAADFDVFTVRAAQGKNAQLRFTSQFAPYPTSNHNHHCELVDIDGTVLASVTGDGTSAPFTIPHDGVYTLFVKARDESRSGWFTATLECLDWPSCDPEAHADNYGNGTPGTLGVPSLTASAAPRLGSTFDVQLNNCAGQTTMALLLVGFDRDRQHMAAYSPSALVNAYLLVDSPVVMTFAAVPVGGMSLSVTLPPASAQGAFVLTGITAAAQALVVDANAAGGIAFSPGLLLKLGS